MSAKINKRQAIDLACKLLETDKTELKTSNFNIDNAFEAEYGMNISEMQRLVNENILLTSENVEFDEVFLDSEQIELLWEILKTKP